MGFDDALGDKRVAPCNHISSCILITLEADAGRHETLCVVVLQFATSKVQICQQCRLCSCGCLVDIVLEQIHRQYATEHGYLVDMPLHHPSAGGGIGVGGAQSEVIAHDAAQAVHTETLDKFFVHIDITHISRTGDSHREMVPVAVAAGGIGWELTTSRAYEEASTLDTHIDVVAGIGFCLCLSVGKEGSLLVGGVEPEHQRVVLSIGAHKAVRLQTDAVRAVETHGYALRTLPVCAAEC